MAEAIGAFVVGRASIDELERRFPWLHCGDRARAHEGGRLVDYEWRAWLERSELAADPLDRAIGSLLRACAARPRLRALLPFTSVGRLRFSHTTGYPYESMATYAFPATRDVPGATTWLERIVSDRFLVVRRGHESETLVGEGNADWAATTLEQEVPHGWGPARDGTEEDAPSRGPLDHLSDEPYNAIFAAIAHMDSAALRAAILAGVDVNEADLRPYVGNINTPLHHAASHGNAELVRILLEAGAHVDARCAAGWTPLGLACNAGALDAAKLLVEAGADLEAANGEGYTPTDRVPGTAPELLAYMRAPPRTPLARTCARARQSFSC